MYCSRNDVASRDKQQIREKLKDASRYVMVQLYVTDEKIKAYIACWKMCWQSDNPIYVLKDLNDKYQIRNLYSLVKEIRSKCVIYVAITEKKTKKLIYICTIS